MKLCPTCKVVYDDQPSTCKNDDAPLQSVSELPPGARLGVYEIVKQLGAGGMGFVYEANHQSLKRRCAIKLLRPEFANHSGVVARFLGEARAVNVINHDNIVSIFDYAESGSAGVYFVMEFLEGEDFSDLINRMSGVPMPLLFHIFDQLMSALQAAHDKQIVHRDLKPANVFLTRREGNPYHVKLLDFGIAKLRGEVGGKAMTVAGDVMGTPQYMSPEQINGILALDSRADVWAVGVMLYKAATNVAPFRGEGFADVARAVLADSPPPPSKAGAGFSFPVGFDEAVLKCLQRDPAQRWQSVADLQQALANIRVKAGIEIDEYLAAAEPARDSHGSHAEPSLMARSLPAFQGAADVANKAERKRAKKSSLLPVAIGGAVVAGGVAAFLLLRGGASDKSSEAGSGSAQQVQSGSNSASGSSVAAKPELGLARLKEALTKGDQAAALDAVVALDLVGGDDTSSLLVDAIALGPEVRMRAARSLAQNSFKIGAAPIRQALDGAGPKQRVELAACAFLLGDKTMTGILRKGLDDIGMRATAARALVTSEDTKLVGDAVRVLKEIAADAPPGRESWLQAQLGLARSGDSAALQALVAESEQADAARSLAARIALTDVAKEKYLPLLTKMANDEAFARRSEAALATLRAGGSLEVAWVEKVLASSDPDERRYAVAIVARSNRADFVPRVKQLAQSDAVQAVRFTALAAVGRLEKAK